MLFTGTNVPHVPAGDVLIGAKVDAGLHGEEAIDFSFGVKFCSEGAQRHCGRLDVDEAGLLHQGHFLVLHV